LGKRGSWLRQLAALHINVDPLTKKEGRPFSGPQGRNCTAGDDGGVISKAVNRRATVMSVTDSNPQMNIPKSLPI
jgi:hypothetical protein